MSRIDLISDDYIEIKYMEYLSQSKEWHNLPYESFFDRSIQLNVSDWVVIKSNIVIRNAEGFVVGNETILIEPPPGGSMRTEGKDGGTSSPPDGGEKVPYGALGVIFSLVFISIGIGLYKEYRKPQEYISLKEKDKILGSEIFYNEQKGQIV
jgi:hypothetical protein